MILLVLVGGGIGAFAFVQSRPSPQHTLQTYCNDLKTGNYHEVYHLYSSKLRSKTTEDEFVKEFAAGIGILGGIKDCTVSNVVQDSSTKAHGSVTYTFSNGKTETETGPMVLEDGDWKLDSSSSS